MILDKGKVTLRLDPYEYGVIFHSLNDKRSQMIRDNQPTDAVDDVLLKVIQLGEPKKERGGRRFYER